MANIAIIGCGLSGLTAANSLKNHTDITLFEKSRGVSGRMSTRRAEPYFFDHGAQYFKARSNKFKDFIAPMIEKGIVQCWHARFAEFENKQIVQRRQWNQDSAHYVGVPGMSAIVKELSHGLHVMLETQVTHVTKHQDKWILKDDTGGVLGEYDWVISAIPAEQASSILPSSLAFYSKLKSIKMTGCFSLMLGFENSLPLSFDVAMVRNEDISWISVNSSKPGRETPFSLIVHSSNNWADKHIDDDRSHIMHHICDQASKTIDHDLSSANYKAIHGWRFANAEKQTNVTHLIDLNENIGICGDWFIQGRVEAAFTSGSRLASEIISQLSNKSV